MRQYLLIVALLIGGTVAAQPGYYGKKFSIEIKPGILPSTRMVNSMTSYYNYTKMKFANFSYQASFSYAATRKLEITGGLQYAKINFSSYNRILDYESSISYSPSPWFQTELYVLEEADGMYYGGFAGLNFFYHGSLSPLGKYFGFIIAAGNTSVKEGETFLTGGRFETKSTGIFVNKYSTIIYSIADTATFSEKLNVQSAYLKLRFGRNFPLTRSLMLTAGVTIPFLSYYKSGVNTSFGFQIRGMTNTDYFNNDNWLEYTLNSVKPYHRLMFEIGLKYNFRL